MTLFNKPSIYYLKDKNEILGVIDNGGNVVGNLSWSKEELEKFLSRRIFSKHRSDLRTLLSRLDLKQYDVLEIAKKTRGFSLADTIWLSTSKQEDYEATRNLLFIEMYGNNEQSIPNKITSPGGINTKSYYFKDGKVGIRKYPIIKKSYDNLNEIVVTQIGKALGLNMSDTELLEDGSVFSIYSYIPWVERFHHMSELLNENLSDNLAKDLIEQFPNLKEDLCKMFILDFITFQDDRHLDNIGIITDSKGTQRLCPLYDNGRSLLYDIDEQTIKSINDNLTYVTAFGEVGTYFDAIDVAKNNFNINELVNLDVDIHNCFNVYRDKGLYDLADQLEKLVMMQIDYLRFSI